MIGIYCFENKLNGKKYIGQSINIEKRYKEHQYNSLRPNYCNYNSKFYRALRKYGFDNFKFSVLEICDQKDLNEKEIFYIQKFDSRINGYNSTNGGEDNPSNYKEIVNKRTKKLLHDPVINAKLSHAGADNGNAKVTENDVKQIRILYSQGKTFSEVYNLYKDKIGRGGFQYIWLGKTWSDIMPEVYSNLPQRNKGGSKLTENDVRDIRIRCLRNNENKEKVYLDYSEKVGKVGFNKILKYLTWKDIII